MVNVFCCFTWPSKPFVCFSACTNSGRERNLYYSFIHTYIHNWSLQLFSQDYVQLLTPLMLCAIILYVSGRTYNLTSTQSRRFFEKLFYGRFIYSQSLATKLLRGIRRRSILFLFHISFWCLTWNTNPGFTFNKPPHYLLDYGDVFTIQVPLIQSLLWRTAVYIIEIECW